MRLPSTLSISILAMSLILLAAPVMAAPTSLSRLSTQHEFSPKDQADLQAYVDLHVSRLDSENPADLTGGRMKLIGTLRGPTASRVSPAFRQAYADILIPKLQELLDTGGVPSGIAAMQITGYLGTNSATDFILTHLNTADEPREAIRLWSAASLRDLVANPNVSSATIEHAMQTLATAMETEQSWAVQRQAFVTVGKAIQNRRKVEDGRNLLSNSARSLQGQMLANTIRRIGQGETTLVLAIEPATGVIRDQYLDRLMFDRQKDLAIVTVPALAGMHGSVLNQWDALRDDPRLARSAELALHKGEVLMALMDSRLTGSDVPETIAYEGTITNDQRETVEAGRQNWSTIATKSRYN